MHDLIAALYDETGIALDADDLRFYAVRYTWRLTLGGHVVGAMNAAVTQPPDARAFVRSLGGARRALSTAMQAWLSESVPGAMRIVRRVFTEGAERVSGEIVDASSIAPGFLSPDLGLERGWPHFVLRLYCGDLDVEIDANPYDPLAPFDLDDLHRQAKVLARATRPVSSVP